MGEEGIEIGTDREAGKGEERVKIGNIKTEMGISNNRMKQNNNRINESLFIDHLIYRFNCLFFQI